MLESLLREWDGETVACDFFAPCALGGVLNANSIPQLKCRAVVGGANNQLAGVEDAERLRAGGILYAPDFVVNVGGALFILGVEARGLTRQQAENEVVETIRLALRQVFALADTEAITTEAAALQIARQRLSAPAQPQHNPRRLGARTVNVKKPRSWRVIESGLASRTSRYKPWRVCAAEPSAS